ncbi:MAG: DUF3999 domain-containing protein [Actinomycetota bacterium]|nr:DUF3999 domain-containing protein [Actinomycetota bacterium]
MRAVALAATLALAAPAPALAVDVDATGFRYERRVKRAEPGRVAIEPDEALLSHARPGLADLRILDADGNQVPWRVLSEGAGRARVHIPALNVGRRGASAVALLDLGPQRRIVDRLVLDIPDSKFVGRAFVSGADRRRRPYTHLGATTIYDVRGRRHARSTTVSIRPTDFRYIWIRATDVARIDGATIARSAKRRLVEREVVQTKRREHEGRTVVTLDVAYRDVPVDEVHVEAATPKYERAVEVAGSNDGAAFVPVGGGRISRFAGSTAAPIAVRARHRYVRVTIVNGDDEPLRGLRVSLRARSRAVLLEPGHRPPFRLLYGKPGERAPSYEFARLPLQAPEDVRFFALTPERLNAVYKPPPDTRSFTQRHGWVVEAALAVAAFVVGITGLLALRRRA